MTYESLLDEMRNTSPGATFSTGENFDAGIKNPLWITISACENQFSRAMSATSMAAYHRMQ